jgi:hypothetical protein
VELSVVGVVAARREEIVSELKAMLWTGSDAPDRNATLSVHPTWGPSWERFVAIWEPNFCGCEECHCIQGFGATEEEAVLSYWEEWEDRHGETR